MSQSDNSIINFVRGIFIVFGSHVLVLVPLLLLAWIGTVTKIDYLQVPLVVHCFGVGITQLVYVILIGIDYQRQGEYDVVKGIIVGAVITALLNGGCWLYAFSFSR